MCQFGEIAILRFKLKYCLTLTVQCSLFLLQLKLVCSNMSEFMQELEKHSVLTLALSQVSLEFLHHGNMLLATGFGISVLVQ